MSLERHDLSERECTNQDNTRYVEAYMDWITPKIYGVVCDVGSGLGYPTVKYAEKENVTKVVTTDKFFDPAKTLTHEKIERSIVDTEVFIKFPSEKFDCIVSTEHIEHLTEPVQIALLEWVKKTLKEDGEFFGSMPDCEHSGNPFHLKEYTHTQWEDILKKYFLNVEVVVLLPNLLYVWRANNKTNGSYTL